MTSYTKPEKPLGQKAYGSIPHLPNSRRGPADRGLSESQARICTHQARDKHDLVIVQEKLDGSNCSVAKLGGKIIALTRAGYLAETSEFEQHWWFAGWVKDNEARFDALLNEGERCVGEWLAQAHGTRYALTHEPYVIFDLMTGTVRQPYEVVKARCSGFVMPRTLHVGGPISIEQVLPMLEVSGHGALDPVEGAVWRVERKGVVDILAKYVRPEKVDGAYFENETWNWRPEFTSALPKTDLSRNPLLRALVSKQPSVVEFAEKLSADCQKAKLASGIPPVMWPYFAVERQEQIRHALEIGEPTLKEPARFLVEGEPPVVCWTVDAYNRLMALYTGWKRDGLIKSFIVTGGPDEGCVAQAVG